MQSDETIKTYSAEELRGQLASDKDQSDWVRVDAMSEEALEASLASDPDWSSVPADWHRHAVPHFPKGHKQQITLRVDPDVLAWFKETGKGYQTRINAVLRAFVSSQQ